MTRDEAIKEIRLCEKQLSDLGVKEPALPDSYLLEVNEEDLDLEVEALRNQVSRKRAAQEQDKQGKKKMNTQTAPAPQPATETVKPIVPPACQRSIQDIVIDLSKGIATKHLSTRKQGGKDLTYISWYNAEKYLDHYASGWKKEVKEVMNIAGKVAITIRLIIPCLEGEVWREATGCEEETTNSFGDSFSNAESMAFRRACAQFGLGRYLYDK